MGARVWRLAVAVAAVAVLAGGALGPTSPAGAHTPHDDVFGVAVSPGFVDDGTAIVVARGIAYRTTDGGRTWERLVAGLTNRDALSSVAVTCCGEPTYLVAAADDGPYRSTDGGDTWTAAADGVGVRTVHHLVASPSVPDLAYALTDEEVLRTTDAGVSWEPIEGPTGELTGIGLGSVAPDEVLVGGAEGTVHRSTDGGDTWTTVDVEGAGAIRSLARVDADVVLLGTDDRGVVRVDGDLGDPTSVELPGATVGAVSSLAVTPTAVWASVADDGTWRSDDGGATWTAATDGLTRSPQADAEGFEDRAHFGDVVVAPAAEGEDPTVLLAAFAGLFLLDPGADSWREAELMRSRIVVGLAVSPDYANDGTVAVTTYMNGASRSTDGGDTWAPINDGLEEEVLYGSGDDRFARLFGIAFSPSFAEDATMVAARWTDAITSDDAGASWSPAAVVPGDDPPLQQFALSFAPGREPGSTVVLTGSRDGGVHRSTDGGRTYDEVGSIDGQVRSIVAVADRPGSFLAATQRGVFASDDEGETWTTLTGDLRDVVNLAPSPTFGDDAIAFAATRRGLWSTRDGGSTWVQADEPRGLRSGFVEGVAVSPAFVDDGIVLASVRGQGLLRSTDGGATFAPIATELADQQLELSNYPNATAVPFAFSPAFADDRTVFGFSGDDVLRSVDGGASWEVLELPVDTHEPVVDDAGAEQEGPDGSADGSDGGGVGVPALAVGAVLVGVAVGAVLVVRRRGGSAT